MLSTALKLNLGTSSITTFPLDLNHQKSSSTTNTYRPLPQSTSGSSVSATYNYYNFHQNRTEHKANNYHFT